MRIDMECDNQRIADLLVSAFEGGSGYWARISGPYVAPLRIVRGEAYMLVVDCEERKTYSLDREAIERGLGIFRRTAPRHFGNWLAEHDDAETGDVFLQCCILGEVTYG